VRTWCGLRSPLALLFLRKEPVHFPAFCEPPRQGRRHFQQLQTGGGFFFSRLFFVPIPQDILKLSTEFTLIMFLKQELLHFSLDTITKDIFFLFSFFFFLTECLFQSFPTVGINCGCMVEFALCCPLVSHASITVRTLLSLLVPSVTLYLRLPNPFCLPLSPHSLSGSWPDPRPQAKGIRQGEGTENQCFLCSPALSGRSCRLSNSFSEEGPQTQSSLAR